MSSLDYTLTPTPKFDFRPTSASSRPFYCPLRANDSLLPLDRGLPLYRPLGYHVPASIDVLLQRKPTPHFMSKPFSEQTPPKTPTYLPISPPKTIIDELEEKTPTSALPKSSQSPPLLAPATRPASKSPATSVAPAADPASEERVVVAVDYGTTFTGVAYLVVKHKEEDLDGLANEIKVIQSWKKHSTEKVPSDFSYSPSLVHSCEQWGYDIDDNSRVLRWTKLSLEPSNDRILELQNLKNLLYEMRHVDLSHEKIINNDIPRHLGKEPEDIVTDYLENVAEKTLDEITSQVGSHVPNNVPIDIVVTHPAV